MYVFFNAIRLNCLQKERTCYNILKRLCPTRWSSHHHPSFYATGPNLQELQSMSLRSFCLTHLCLPCLHCAMIEKHNTVLCQGRQVGASSTTPHRGFPRQDVLWRSFKKF